MRSVLVESRDHVLERDALIEPSSYPTWPRLCAPLGRGCKRRKLRSAANHVIHNITIQARRPHHPFTLSMIAATPMPPAVHYACCLALRLRRSGPPPQRGGVRTDFSLPTTSVVELTLTQVSSRSGQLFAKRDNCARVTYDVRLEFGHIKFHVPPTSVIDTRSKFQLKIEW